MYELISAFGYLGSFQVATAIFSVLRTKLIAVLLGPPGLGIFAQAKSFQMTTRVLITLELEEGIVNLIADANTQDNPDKLKRIVLSVGLVYAFLGSLTLLLCWIFRQTLSEWIFGTDIYGELIVIVGVSAFFFAQHQLMLWVFQGLMKWKLYSIVAIAGYAIGISLSAAFVLFYGIKGSVLSLVITPVTGLIFGLIYVKQNVSDVFIEGLLPDWKVIKTLTKYIGPLLGGGLMLYLTDLYIRRAIIIQLGATQSGIFHVLDSISDVYFWFILQPVLAFSLPKATSLLKDKKGIVDVLNNGIRFSLLGLFPIIMLVYGLREIWIPMLFSNEFLESGNLLLWWLIGDIFKALRINLDIDLIPLDRMKYIVFQTILYCGGLIILSVPFISYLGLKVVATGYLVINIIVFLISFVYHMRSTAFRLSTANFVLLGKASVLLTFGYWWSSTYDMNVIRLITIILILLVMYFWFLKQSERELAISFVRRTTIDIFKGKGIKK